MEKEGKYYCNFCGLIEDETEVIVTSNDADICNLCVSICVDIINEWKEKKKQNHLARLQSGAKSERKE